MKERPDQVVRLQKHMKTIRSILHIRLDDIGKYVYLSKQNINGMESDFVKLSVAQYIAFRIVFNRIAEESDNKTESVYKIFMTRIIDEKEEPCDWLDELRMSIEQIKERKDV